MEAREGRRVPLLCTEGFFPAEYSYTYKLNVFQRLAVGCLPAACCAESNVCADHKPSGCGAIFRPRIPCCRSTDRLGKSQSFKNNSELKLSTWGRAASWAKFADAVCSLCGDGKWWSDAKGVFSFGHCCLLLFMGLQAKEGLAGSPETYSQIAGSPWV